MVSLRAWMLFAAAFAAVAATGCDSSATSTASDGESAPAASIGAPRWNGGPASGERLLGLWVAGDRTAGDDDEKSVRMEQGLAEHTMQFDFRDAQRVYIQLGRDAAVEEGRWEIVRSDGGSLVVRIAAPSCGEKEFRVEFVDENRFTMSPENDAESGLAFTLTRLRSAS